jgi:hypothetical protein
MQAGPKQHRCHLRWIEDIAFVDSLVIMQQRQ